MARATRRADVGKRRVRLFPNTRRGWIRLALLVVVPVALAWAGCAAMISMPGTSHRGPLPPATEDEQALEGRLRGHVERLADTIGERNVWTPEALEAAARYVESVFTDVGGSPRRLPVPGRIDTLVNVEMELPGTSLAEEIVVVGAHYDSVAGCPGANDNASGVAAVLECARLLRDSGPARTVRLVAFVNEEPPFFQTSAMGSLVYARAARQRGDRIVAMLSLETVGCYSDAPGSQQYPPPLGFFYPRQGDFIGFVGNVRSRALVRRCIGSFREHTPFPSEGAAVPGFLTGIGWSDHWSFWQAGYRGVMVTDTAPFRYAHYHRPSDTPDKLDYGRMARVVAGIARVVADLAGE